MKPEAASRQLRDVVTRTGRAIALSAAIGALAVNACSPSPGGSDAGSSPDAGSGSGSSSGSASGGGSGSGSGSSSGGASGSTTGSGSGSVEDGGACNQLMPGAPAILSNSNGTPPTANGGTIASGTYVLTTLTTYGCGPTSSGSSATFAGTFSFTATSPSTGSFELAEAYNGEDAGGSSSSALALSGTYTTSGSNLTLTPTCPLGRQPAVSPYTATASEIDVVDANPNGCLQNGVISPEVDVGIYTKK